MSPDIHHAFEHPEVRAAALADGDRLLDRISLRDHIVDVEIGAFQSERGTTQKIGFNIVVEVVPWDGPLDDDVDRILSYDRITWAIAHELAAERLNLLETLAERVADRILLEPQAVRVFVRIEKLDRGPGALGVEIVRSESQGQMDSGKDTDETHPTVVFLSNNVVDSQSLGGVIEQLTELKTPLIFCVDVPSTKTLSTPAKAAQRRIDLLSIEQNAWVLAGFDKRCVVVESRTELDWAMKNGEISVWAPSKIILDSVDRPTTNAVDGVELAAWFAVELSAKEFVTLGVQAPTLAGLQAREMRLAT